jgi:predicted methyltransferase
MKNRIHVLAPLLVIAPMAACGGAAPPPVAPPPPPVAAKVEPAPTPVDPEVLKKQEAQAKLDADIAAMEADAKKEAERWTPELRAEVKALSDATYFNLKTGLTAALKSAHRAPGNAARDVYRHPMETLTFFGMKPTHTVLEFGGGGGWYTELLAPVLAKKGKLLVTSLDPSGPVDQRSTLYGKRFQRFLEKSTELSGKIEPVIIKDSDSPALGHEGQVDLVLALREMHGWVNAGRLDKNLAEVRKVLKKGGVFGVVEHRAKADAVAEESSKKGYLPEAWVIEKVEAAGFKLAGKSEVNANPKDTKDYADGVWTLPPSYRLGDTDHDKYAAIGESDRMTLKFVAK